jgi:translation initiation factor 2 subunit 1
MTDIGNQLLNREKGYIDLSKRRVSEEDVQACEERYNKSKLVHSIMRHVAETLSIDLEEIYTTIGWPLYRKYGHAYEVLEFNDNCFTYKLWLFY